LLGIPLPAAAAPATPVALRSCTRCVDCGFVLS
jgi:hypothetical protein